MRIWDDQTEDRDSRTGTGWDRTGQKLGGIYGNFERSGVCWVGVSVIMRRYIGKVAATVFVWTLGGGELGRVCRGHPPGMTWLL